MGVVAQIIAPVVAIVHARLGQAVCFAIGFAAVFYRFRNLVGAVKYTSMHAGLWRQISEAKAGREITVRKVKAHRSEAKAVGKTTLRTSGGTIVRTLMPSTLPEEPRPKR